jgi:hypothetical protein
VPFIHRTMKLEELVSAREIRSIIKEKFKVYKDVTDPRVSMGRRAGGGVGALVGGGAGGWGVGVGGGGC